MVESILLMAFKEGTGLAVLIAEITLSKLQRCCSAEHVPLVFTPRFLLTLVNSFGHSDAHLHAAAKRLLEQVRAYAATMWLLHSRDPPYNILCLREERVSCSGWCPWTQASEHVRWRVNRAKIKVGCRMKHVRRRVI
jgi:hypothetical protein